MDTTTNNNNNNSNSNSNNASSKIQHVTKKSSDELLRKFAEVGSEKEDKAAAKKELQLAKRLKRSTGRRINKAAAFGHGGGARNSSLTLTATTNASVIEMKSLLSPLTSRRSSGKLSRRLGIGKAKVRAREIKNRSIFGTVAKVRFLFF